MTTTRCACSRFKFGILSGDDTDWYTTDCHQVTTNVFAQGHDAKLVGFLVRAELGGEEVWWTENGVHHTLSGAAHVAQMFSDALAAKTRAQLDAAKARLAKKAEAAAAKQAKRSATKAAKIEADVVQARPARIKVRRWEYDAMINANGAARYTNAKGEVVFAQQGQYREV